MDTPHLAQVITLRTLTFSQPHQEPLLEDYGEDADPCDGTFTCPCPDCEADRADAVARGVRSRQPQPWQPRLKRAA